MTAFDDRKTAAEAKFTHDQEFQFKTIARRNKLLGLWAAEQMGISGADAEAYAKQVVIADFEEPGDADVLRKVLGDLTDKGIATDEHKVRHAMTRLLEEAKTKVSIEWNAIIINRLAPRDHGASATQSNATSAAYIGCFSEPHRR